MGGDILSLSQPMKSTHYKRIDYPRNKNGESERWKKAFNSVMSGGKLSSINTHKWWHNCRDGQRYSESLATNEHDTVMSLACQWTLCRESSAMDLLPTSIGRNSHVVWSNNEDEPLYNSVFEPFSLSSLEKQPRYWAPLQQVNNRKSKPINEPRESNHTHCCKDWTKMQEVKMLKSPYLW